VLDDEWVVFEALRAQEYAANSRQGIVNVLHTTAAVLLRSACTAVTPSSMLQPVEICYSCKGNVLDCCNVQLADSSLGSCSAVTSTTAAA
jgi:hypothetical protein